MRRAEVCFVGDSLTEFWQTEGSRAWRHDFAGWRTVNCGISADRTEHILYRLASLDLRKARPRVIVLLMGTNNLGMENPDSPAEVAKACQFAVRYISGQSADSHILLLTIPPSDNVPNSPLRRAIRRTNQILTSLSLDDSATVVETYPHFADADDQWLPGLTLDGTHFSAKGYEVLAQVLRPRLIKILGEPKK